MLASGDRRADLVKADEDPAPFAIVLQRRKRGLVETCATVACGGSLPRSLGKGRHGTATAGSGNSHGEDRVGVKG